MRTALRGLEGLPWQAIIQPSAQMAGVMPVHSNASNASAVTGRLK